MHYTSTNLNNVFSARSFPVYSAFSVESERSRSPALNILHNKATSLLRSQVMTEEMSFLVSLENCQGFRVPDGGEKFIPQGNYKEITKAWTRSCAACSVRKGLIFLRLCRANLQDRAVFGMCSLKVSWSSKIPPRFLTELDGVIVEVLSWMVKSCCRVRVAGKTRSSVFARLSCS